MIGYSDKSTTYTQIDQLIQKSTFIDSKFADSWWGLYKNNEYYFIVDPPSQDNEGRASIIVIFTIDDIKEVEDIYKVKFNKL